MGESLEHLSNRLKELTPIHCVECGEAHMKWVRHRTSEEKGSFLLHFPELAGSLFHGVKLLKSQGAERLDIMVAGCADTGLLALCAHIARHQRAFPQIRVRFHLLDKCQTPLILCEEFAALHDLAVTTRLCRIPRDDPGFSANLILADSLLRFFPSEEQVGVIQYLARHQEPRGVLVYGQILARDPPMVSRPGTSEDPKDVHAVLAKAGYEFDQETVTDRHLRLTNGASRWMKRYVAVATRSG
jgi:hypothetical protein